MQRFWMILFLALLQGVLCGAPPAEAMFDAIYVPHMVLQREVRLPIRGTGAPKAAVTVSFAGQTQKGVVGADGRWQVALDPVRAGGPFTLAVVQMSGTMVETQIEDVLVGDVWVASGQSNMAWQVRQSVNGKEEVKGAQLPLLRGCLVPYVKGKDTPQEAAQMKWCRSDKLDEMVLLSGQGYFFAREIAQRTGVPIGIISVAKGGTPAEAFMRRELLEANADFRPIVERMDTFDREYPKLKAAFDAGQAKRDVERAEVVAEAKAAGKAPPPPKRLVPPDYHSRPCAIWNTLIYPLTKLPIKGVVWNQGVSNAGYSEIYAELFQALIRDWRAQWNCGEFPFLFVQIERNNHYKSLKEAPPVAGDDEWAEIREAQAKSLATPNTYMVPAFDQGEDGTNRHPLDKKTPGLRLANMALRHVYGMQDVVADAPRFVSAKAVAGGMEITFRNVAGGLKVGTGGAGDAKGETETKVIGFAVANAARQWVWTEAEIVRPDTVLVRYPKEKPEVVAVRYNWAQYCLGNLYGGAGLPAEPMRTDEWPYLTAGKR